MSNPKSKQLARAQEQVRRGHTADARQWFASNRDRLLASRPVIEPARTETLKVPMGDGKSYTRRIEIPPVFGPPTFRNVIENGEHV